jgi:aspartate/methionine/tyrosine aminotransferase
VSDADSINQTLAAEAPALGALLSPLGRRAVYPRGIPFQAAEARGKAYNGTIGQITDGRGGAVPLPSMAAALGGLGEAERNRALLYSPIDGIPEVRRAWRDWQRRDAPEGGPSSLPLVTVGLTHGLALCADLFAGEGRAVVVPDPFRGNYRQTFATRTGARLVPAPAYRDGAFYPEGLAEALETLPAGEPALAIVNFPSNPGGYSPTAGERRRLAESLAEAAERRPLGVLCDDAYAGLVYEEGIPRRSMFWELAGLHPGLAPVKIDGATKEFSFFGGRVGFLTFAVEEGSGAAAALDSKVKCLLRATVGSPVAASQMVLAAGLASGTREAEVEAVRALLAGRYRALAAALAGCDPELFGPLPFNSGCFAVVELGADLGVGAEAVRRHLLDRHDTGLVSIEPRYLRIAHCSVAAEELPELVRRLERGVAELAGRAPDG